MYVACKAQNAENDLRLAGASHARFVDVCGVRVGEKVQVLHWYLSSGAYVVRMP